MLEMFKLYKNMINCNKHLQRTSLEIKSLFTDEHGVHSVKAWLIPLLNANSPDTVRNTLTQSWEKVAATNNSGLEETSLENHLPKPCILESLYKAKD